MPPTIWLDNRKPNDGPLFSPERKDDRFASRTLLLGTNLIRARFKGMPDLSNWPRNRLLLALPARNLKQLMPELENIRCQREQVLMDVDRFGGRGLCGWQRH